MQDRDVQRILNQFCGGMMDTTAALPPSRALALSNIWLLPMF